MYNVPILLISFNRPAKTRLVLEAIKSEQPEKLFCFVDKESIIVVESLYSAVPSLFGITSTT